MSAGSAQRLKTAPDSAPERMLIRRVRLLRMLPVAVFGATVVIVGSTSGGYGLTSRTMLAVALWWAIMIGVGFGLLPRTTTVGAVVAVGLFAAFSGWTLASVLWAADAEGAFNEFNRVCLYLAVLVLSAFAVRRRELGRCADGLCVGIVSIAVIALASRLFPQLTGDSDIAAFIPNAATRLSFPIGYWNALGILVSFGLPLCFRGAMIAQHHLSRALSVAMVPVLVSVIFLTSSRGAVATALLATVVFLIAAERRWAAFGVCATAAGGSALALAFLLQHSTLVDGPLTSPAATSEGRRMFVAICVCIVVTGAALLGGEALRRRFHPRPRLGSTLVVATVAVGLVGLVMLDPAARFEEFKRPPVADQVSASGSATTHLLAGSGSGRWQFWSAAVEEFESAPLRGHGAGSYEAWWAQHASFPYSLRNAHSLYLEVLGELGIVGLLLVVGALLGGFGFASRRLRGLRGEERITVAAFSGVFVAFLLGAALDWIWQVTVVGLVGVAALGLIVGPGAAKHDSDRRTHRKQPRRVGIGPDIAVIAVAWALICAQALPWLAAGKISDSQAAVRRGASEAAFKDALDAKSIQPWVAAPYVQLALVVEQQGDLEAARRWIVSALRRDSSDWRIWLVASRIERESGLDQEAAKSYARAKSLNPLSPIFSEP